MKDDQIGAILREANPWWLAQSLGTSRHAWITSHRVLRDRARFDLGYRSQVLADVTSGPVDDKLIVLTGPQRVGKSGSSSRLSSPYPHVMILTSARLFTYLPMDSQPRTSLEHSR